MNLSNLSSAELESLIEDAKKELVVRRETEKQEAIKQIHSIAAQTGFSLEELLASKAVRKKRKVKPKYCDPDDPTNTWTGRGRKPRWLAKALDEGKSLEDFLI